MDYHEKIVYKILQKADDMGCTIGELRQKVLSQNPSIQANTMGNAQLNTILKGMEKKGFIKNVVGRLQPNRKKVFMLTKVTPNAIITGGAGVGCTDA